ncbi:hypothetical protein AB0H77_22190 [Streptomyces sp. NPDC050844]|uniref:hypothetical protein n=1 Tax=Streptomyces sp. NPDC050844 TaxID=3155790 RepID=UPI0033D16C62
MIPPTLANATRGMDDKATRHLDTTAKARIDSRLPFFLHLNQGPDQTRAIRLACPAVGTSPTVNCPLRPSGSPPSRTLDLTDPRQIKAHPAARPTLIVTDTRRTGLPDICRQQSITIRPGDLGTMEKFRQDLPYLTDAWRSVFTVIRAQNEGVNGILKGHKVDISEPKSRLAHGRVAQTLLVALMVTIANLMILDTYCQAAFGEHLPATSYDDGATANEPDLSGPQATGRPPPQAPR